MEEQYAIQRVHAVVLEAVFAVLARNVVGHIVVQTARLAVHHQKDVKL